MRSRLNAPMDELSGGIRRLTFPLPLGIPHVHCYLLPGEDGWTLVDTGLGLPGAQERLAPLAELDAPVKRIVVTHFHPDHVGGGEDAQALTAARVLQGAHDYEQCERVWGTPDWSERLADSLVANGLPEGTASDLRPDAGTFRPFTRYAPDPALGQEPRTGYEVSVAPFGEELDASERRFALAEALAHLERLVRKGRARRGGDGSTVSYTGM